MEKYKFLIFDETMDEPIHKVTNVSNKIVKIINEALSTINDETVIISHVLINKDLKIQFSVIEKINGEQYLTHILTIQPNI